MFSFFPYTNFHRLNADWVLKTIEELKTTIETIASRVTTTLANAVLYTSQNKTASEQRIACGNINAVSYHTQGSSQLEKTQARANIGAVGYEAQTLSAAQQTQARTNIGAAASSDIPDVSDVVRTSEQSLTNAQRVQARTNIDAASTGAVNTANGRIQTLEDSVVRFTEQSLSTAQKTQARTNIGAVGYEAQTLSAAQKTQARTNIGAAASSDIPPETLVVMISPNELETDYECDKTVSEIVTAFENNIDVIFNFMPIGQDINFRALPYVDTTTTPNKVISYVWIPTASTQPSNGRWYYIEITAGAPDTLFVELQNFRLLPPCTNADAGKIAVVGGNGQPIWVSNPLMVVVFSGSNDTSDATCNVSYNTLLSAINSGAIVIVNYHGTETYEGVSIYNLEFMIDDAGFSLSRIDNFGIELTIVYDANSLSISFST